MMAPFDTQLLDEVLAARNVQREQERCEVLHQVVIWLQQVGCQYGIDRAYIFGSVTQSGRFHEASDVDLGVEVMNSVQQIDAIAALSMVLLRDVDLVDLRYCHFAHRIRETGLLWIRDS
jgi:predicted nucleotidyltransferase